MTPLQKSVEAGSEASVREKLEGLATGLDIDRESLDIEVTRQPVKFYQVAGYVEELTSSRDRAKDLLGESYSQVSERIRKEFDDRGEKTTETRITALANGDPEYVEARDHYNRLRELTGTATALKESFMQRSYMIRDLVSLHLGGYAMRTSLDGKSHTEVKREIIAKARERRKLSA